MKNNPILYLALLCSLSISAFAESRDVVVSASRLNVRDADGEILCSVSRDTNLEAVGRKTSTESLKVKLDSARCPGIKEGFVAAKYVRPKSGQNSNQFSIDVDGLSLRSSPSYDDSAWKCALPKDTKVFGTKQKIVVQSEVTWVNIKLMNPIPGCPDEGFVANSYVSTVDSFADLPMVSDTEDCVDCENAKKSKKGTTIGVLSGVSSDLNEKLNPDQRSNPFISEIRKMIKNPKYKPKGIRSNRGLAQIPLIGKRGNIGPCGSHHYSPDKPIGVDAYANPLTACAFVSALQDWKKTACPDGDAGCTVSWGDISHKSLPEFSGHRTHTNGQCIDIRPMREGSFQDAPITYKSKDYDQKKMKEFVKFLRSKGGSNLYFNDTSMGTTAIKGHYGHIHVCFKNNERTREACNNLQVDTNVCPELQ